MTDTTGTQYVIEMLGRTLAERDRQLAEAQAQLQAVRARLAQQGQEGGSDGAREPD